MPEERASVSNVMTNFLLAVIVAVLIIIAFSISNLRDQDRYSFAVYNPANEVYVFDKYSGKLFITSPEIISDYADEIWTQLDPTAKGKTLSFKEFLYNKANRDLKKRFMEEKRQIEAQPRNPDGGE